MGRFLWVLLVLPLCLIGVYLISHYCCNPEIPSPEPDDDIPTPFTGTAVVVTRAQQEAVSQEVAAALGLMSSAPVHGALVAPWTAIYQIGNKQLVPLEKLMREQPVEFLQMCLDRYDREIQGYTVLFCKQERVKKTLQAKEEIVVHFRQKPFSVHFSWNKGGGLAKKVNYVEGENDGNMRVRPVVGWIMTKDPDGTEAMRTSRFSIKKFGVRHGLQSTVNSMTRAKAKDKLNVKYLGEFKVERLGGRACYKFVRTPYDPPEDERPAAHGKAGDGNEERINEYTFYIDVETWLHVGSELKNVDGELIAEYYFRDLKPNVEIDNSIFTDKGL